jgi:hypothetical protein
VSPVWRVYKLIRGQLSVDASTKLFVRQKMIRLWLRLETNFRMYKPSAVVGRPEIGYHHALDKHQYGGHTAAQLRWSLTYYSVSDEDDNIISKSH